MGDEYRLRFAVSGRGRCVLLLLTATASVGCATQTKEPPQEPRTNCEVLMEQHGRHPSALRLPPAEYDFCRQPRGFGETSWISLERKECFGTCPVFALTVFPDGRLFYNGKRFVMRQGVERASLPAATVDQLRRAIEESHFATLDSNCCDCRTKTDAPWTYVEIADESGQKLIRHYHGCSSVPGSLTALEDAVIRLTGATKWIGTDAERQRQNWTRDSQ
jgi:hypothetical protein